VLLTGAGLPAFVCFMNTAREVPLPFVQLAVAVVEATFEKVTLVAWVVDGPNIISRLLTLLELIKPSPTNNSESEI